MSEWWPEEETPGCGLADFLLARIAEDEWCATERVTPGPWFKGVAADGSQVVHSEALVAAGAEYADVAHPACMNGDAAHIARHDPDRVLSDCAAKRSIVEEWARCEEAAKNDDRDLGNAAADTAQGLFYAVSALALTYSGHDDYRDEWKP